MNSRRLTSLLLSLSLAALTACTVHVSDKNGDTKSDSKVDIDSPLGALKVRTDKVDPRDTGLSVYPGATIKPKSDKEDDDHDSDSASRRDPKTGMDKDEEVTSDNKADVNIQTPWFGVKVVAVTFLSDDAPDKVWDFYKKDMAKYGTVLQCKPGSPDLDKAKKNKDDISCKNDTKNEGLQIKVADHELKVGTEDRQHIVSVKPHGKGSEFSLVFVSTRGSDKNSM